MIIVQIKFNRLGWIWKSLLHQEHGTEDGGGGQHKQVLAGIGELHKRAGREQTTTAHPLPTKQANETAERFSWGELPDGDDSKCLPCGY